METITPEEAAAWLAEVTGQEMSEAPEVEVVDVEDAAKTLQES